MKQNLHVFNREYSGKPESGTIADGVEVGNIRFGTETGEPGVGIAFFSTSECVRATLPIATKENCDLLIRLLTEARDLAWPEESGGELD